MDELVTAAGRQSERLIAIRQDDQIILLKAYRSRKRKFKPKSRRVKRRLSFDDGFASAVPSFQVPMDACPCRDRVPVTSGIDQQPLRQQQDQPTARVLARGRHKRRVQQR